MWNNQPGEPLAAHGPTSKWACRAISPVAREVGMKLLLALTLCVCAAVMIADHWTAIRIILQRP